MIIIKPQKQDGHNLKKSEFSASENDMTSSNGKGAHGFLAAGNQPSKYVVQAASKSTEIENGEHESSDYVADSSNLTATQLRKKYQLTYSSWKNMKQRVKTDGAVVEQSIVKFKDFLRLIGPRLKKEYTLDRLDPGNSAYGPGLVRWADKKTQASNKANSIYLTYKGETLSLVVWAEKTNQNYATLYKRHKAKWSDEEVVTGIKEDTHDSIWSETPWPEGREEEWEHAYQKQVSNGLIMKHIPQSISRLEFYYYYSEMHYNSAKNAVEQYAKESIPESALLNYKNWHRVFSDAYHLKESKAKRDAFIKRDLGGLGVKKEAALYDLMYKKYGNSKIENQ